jgi:hypothetical protein
LLGHRFQAYEVENVVSASGEESADGFDRFGFGGVNDIGCAEPLRSLQPIWLNVDDHNPRRAGYARTADGVEPNTTGTEDNDGVASAHVSSVQDGARAGDNAAAEQRRLGERHILRQKGELIFMDERAFGKAAEPQALEQANAMAA